MRLLVTRPEPDAARTAAALAALGHDVILAPLLAAEPLPPPPALPPPAAVLLTSAHAARALSAWPETLLPRRLPVLAVGDHTAEAAREAGFADIRSAAGDGAALAQLAASMLKPADGPLLYPTLARPARDLQALLGAAGFSVLQVEAYRMTPAARLPMEAAAGLADGSIEGVLLYSRRTAETFAGLAAPLRPHLAALHVYCLSADVAAAVDFGLVAVAAAPNEAALLALIGAGTEAAGIH